MPPVHQSQAEDVSKFDQALFYQALACCFVSRPAAMLKQFYFELAFARQSREFSGDNMSSDVRDTSTSWFEFLGWLETHKQNLMWAGIGGLIIVFVSVAYRWRVTQTEHAANEALLALRPAVSSPASSEAAATAAEYLKIAKDYAGTDAAERALVLGAGALFAEGKYSEAQTEFENFVRERPDSWLAAIAAYGVAASLEAQGKNDQALTAYRDVPVRYPRSALIDESKLALARIYEAKSQPDLALKTYEEIARPGTSGSASSQAMQRKQQLLAAHPELAKTNAVSTLATNAPLAPVVSTNTLRAQP